MKEDLQYKIIQDMNDNILVFEAKIAAYDFPLIVDGDWNPYIFEKMKWTKEEFLSFPPKKKLLELAKNFIMNKSPEEQQAYSYRHIKYMIELCGEDKKIWEKELKKIEASGNPLLFK